MNLDSLFMISQKMKSGERTVYRRSQDDTYPAVKRYDGGNGDRMFIMCILIEAIYNDFQYVHDNEYMM